MPLSKVPYWRLSGFYFFYFACLGVLVPYWGLYLQWEGFSARQIGELTAIILAARIFAPYLWGWIADHTNRRIQVVRLTSIISAVSFSAIYLDQSYLWIAIVSLVFSFFWNAALPQFEVTTLQHLGKNSHYYSRIRLWGSIGFIVVVVLIGKALEVYEESIIPAVICLSLFGIWIMSLTLTDKKQPHHDIAHEPISRLLKQPHVIAFLLMCFLAQASHGPYYTFYSIYLEQHGYSASLIGQLWALGVIAEVFIFLIMHRWLDRFGIHKVLMVTMILTSLRWLMIAYFVDNLSVLIFAQLLHAASYGTYHAAAIAWVHHHFTGKNQGRGQALYSSVSFGAGGVLGSLMSGYFWLSPGSETTFILASTLSLVAFFITWKWLKERNGTPFK